MQLPRRVPWASLAELDEVCAWIYTDADDVQANVSAINRLSAWKTITQLPHALEATLSLLVAILQDNTAASSTSNLSLRQSYAAAIIRLVNGLVDPLQLGAYARSIASIATQLGLPLWLVELRHAATHEHLPSLEVLRDAAQESLGWLLHNYFLPTLNPSTTPLVQEKPLRPLSPLLKQYKNVMKMTTRDASLKGHYKPVMVTLLRDIERWIAEAKVAAPDDSGDIDLDADSELQDLDLKERWALEQFCDGLLEKGSLVPLSKKKRTGSLEVFLPPSSSVLIWSTLLEHVQALHSRFLAVLGHHIIFALLSGSEGSEATQDLSYGSCIVRWVSWIVQKIGERDIEEGESVRMDFVMLLMQALGHADQRSNGKANDILFSLLEELCRGTAQLEGTIVALKSLSMADSRVQGWQQDDIDVMTSRLETLKSTLQSQTASTDGTEEGMQIVDDEEAAPKSGEELPQGWKLLDMRTGWKSRPIGVS